VVLAEGKDCLTVLDFVGNSRPEYDFESKFRALIETTTSVQKKLKMIFTIGFVLLFFRKESKRNYS
jgi:hypothetical protein